MWIAIAIAVIAISLCGGLLAYAVRTAKALGDARREIVELDAQVEGLRASLRRLAGPDPDLDDLGRVFPDDGTP